MRNRSGVRRWMVPPGNGAGRIFGEFCTPPVSCRRVFRIMCRFCGQRPPLAGWASLANMMLRLLFALLLLCGASPSLADTVWLLNGDRLSGQVRLFDGGTLLLETEFGGIVRISAKSVATLETRQRMVIRHQRWRGRKQYATLRAAEQPGRVTLVTHGEPFTVALADLYQIMPTRKMLEDWIWRGNVDFALDFQRGDTDIDDRDIMVLTDFRHNNWRHNLRGEYNREYKDEVRSIDNYLAQYSLDYFIDRNWFWQGRLQYRRDDIEEIARRRSLGTGPGYQFWDNELGAFSLTSLLNVDDYEYADGGDERTASMAVRWDYNRFLVGKTLEIFTNGEIGVPLSSAVSEKLDAQAGLRFRLTSWASFNIRAEWDRVVGDGSINQRRYTLGLGVAW